MSPREPLRARRVRHGMGLVEDDDAGKRVAGLLVQSPRKPRNDLLQSRLASLARGDRKVA